ncbi:sugar ABC transporter ATP-binding protein [Cellulomonas sp. P22]|uniref:sugar ABC transporter ATP-binding protein n=1 Tax=Cellulomonas sp. P22 TaxID=3373189 RepID=UPI0037A8E6D6
MTLALEGITHDYGNGPVLRDVSFTVAPGEVHALLGMNGAGKSTLVHLATGVHTPTGGRVLLDGTPVRFDHPGDAARAGVVLLAQEVDRALVPQLTVHENLTAGLDRARGLRSFSPRRNRQRARELLAHHGVDLDVDRTVASLSLFEKQVLSLVRAVAGDARYLLLDEPTASFDAAETERFYRIVAGLVADGIGIVFISHRLAEVFVLADRVTVLREGVTVLAAPTTATGSRQVVEAMTGELAVARRRSEPTAPEATATDATGEAAPPDAPTGAPALRVRELPLGRGRRPLDLSVGHGEVVVVFGQLGTGKTTLARTLFGLEGPYRVELDGRPVQVGGPAHAARLGFGLVPEERRHHGLWLDEDVRTHLALGFRGLVRPRREDAHARRLVAEYDIQPTTPDQLVRRLSGGNQQKVSIAKWSGARRRVLVLDEPMKGVDVSAKEAIFQAIERSAAAGTGVVYLTAEPDDALRIADRVVVLDRTGPVADRPAHGLEPLDLMLAAEPAPRPAPEKAEIS